MFNPTTTTGSSKSIPRGKLELPPWALDIKSPVGLKVFLSLWYRATCIQGSWDMQATMGHQMLADCVYGVEGADTRHTRRAIQTLIDDGFISIMGTGTDRRTLYRLHHLGYGERGRDRFQAHYPDAVEYSDFYLKCASRLEGAIYDLHVPDGIQGMSLFYRRYQVVEYWHRLMADYSLAIVQSAILTMAQRIETGARVRNPEGYLTQLCKDSKSRTTDSEVYEYLDENGLECNLRRLLCLPDLGV